METHQIKLLKRLRRQVNPKSAYAHAIDLVLNSKNKNEEVQIILEFYDIFTSGFKPDINCSDNLVIDFIRFVETNPAAIQKLIAKKEINYN